MLLSAVWSVDHISMLLAFCNQSCLPKLSVSVDMFCWQLLCSVRVCLCCHAWNDHIWFENMTCSTFLHYQWFVLKQMQPLWLVCCHWRVMLSKAFSSLLRCLASLFVDSSCALVAQFTLIILAAIIWCACLVVVFHFHLFKLMQLCCCSVCSSGVCCYLH